MGFNIGIDIDGCLNNFKDVLGEILKRDYNIIMDEEEYESMTPLGYTRIEEYKDFWKKHDLEFFELTGVLPHASITINRMKKDHKIHIITARDYNTSKLTEEWLNKHKIVYDELYFATSDKVDVCKWKNIDVMVEDKPANALLLAEAGIKVILFEQPYNKTVKHSNIVNCRDWNEIFNYISYKLAKDLKK
jgi:uncharacterized HAD superfamily protein